jgi:hypothetical protein
MPPFIDKFLQKYSPRGQQVPLQQQQKAPLIQLKSNAQGTQQMQSPRPIQQPQQSGRGNIPGQGGSQGNAGGKRRLDIH